MEVVLGSLAVIAVVVVVFLILRELMLWYWRINESLSVLKEIRDLLEAQQKKSTKQPSPAAQTRTEREAIVAERVSVSVDEKELERQALSSPNPDKD